MSSTSVIPARPDAGSRRLKRVTTVLTAAAAALLIGAGPALAHVTVNPGTAAPGSYSKLTFRVPNESDSATTMKLEIQIPTDTPFGSVRAKETPGWTAALTKTKLPAPVTQGTLNLTEAVTQIVFTADPGTDGVGLNEFAEFDISVGPVPDVPSISFKAIQTYSDGTVVNWADPTPPGGEEPEHPAPVLTVTSGGAAPTVHDHGVDAAVGTTSSASSAGGVSVTSQTLQAATADTGESSDGTARTLGTIGIVVGVLGLIVGALGIRRRRSLRGDTT